MTPALWFWIVGSFTLGLLVAVAGVAAIAYFGSAGLLRGFCEGLRRDGIERLSVLSEEHGWVSVTPTALDAALSRAADLAGDRQREREAWRAAQ